MSTSPLKLSAIPPTTPRKSVQQRRSRQSIVITIITLIALLNAIGLLLVLSRLTGALSGDLPRIAMVLAALITTAWATATRIAWRLLFPLEEAMTFETPSEYQWDAIVGWGSSLALILIAIGCCYPANYTSDWLIWFPALVADQFWRQTFFDAGRPALSLDAATTEIDLQLEQQLAATIAFPTKHLPIEHNFDDDLQNSSPLQNQVDNTEQILQQLYRVRDEQGQEIVYGTVRADFETGQRTAVVHVGFCPPLAHIPEIEAESLPGSPCRIKIVQALAHGTRMDVRLPAPAETDRYVLIDMAATPALCQEEIRA